MQFQTDSFPPAQHRTKSLPTISVSALLCVACMMIAAGCGSSETFPVSGTILLDGRPAIAELLFEPLTDAGKRQGQSVTAVAQSDGRFSAALSSRVENASPLPCRISIRIPRSSKGLSSAFDYDALPDKVVELRRELVPGQKLTLLITE